VPAKVIRVGLFSGSSNGAWNPSDWAPAIIQSGTYLGCLPDWPGVRTCDNQIFFMVVSWISLKAAAAAIIDVQYSKSHTVHLRHPRPVAWSSVMGAAATALNIPLVPYDEWFFRLEHFQHPKSQNTSREPGHPHYALRLTDYYRFGLERTWTSATESMALWQV
ncbi:hypothetical protein M422DRAFT_164052, partial [Sphaerobolus stellatus SS14]